VWLRDGAGVCSPRSEGERGVMGFKSVGSGSVCTYLFSAVTIFIPLCSMGAQAQQASFESSMAAPSPLVRGIVDDGQRVVMRGNVHPWAQARFDRGPVEDSFEMGHLQLVLNRSEEQERGLQQFLQEAHTPGSPGYHAWLTPAEFGRRFGAADSDIATVTAWLESHGFRVEKVHPGRIAVQFSGNAARVREAFQTEIHRYVVQGETYFANQRDPQIPAALATVVRGVSPMNSFHPQPLVKVAGQTSYNVKTHQAKAAWTYPTSGGLIFELTPSDFAVQYDVAPVYAAGTTGTGQSIGIISASNIDLSLVQSYQSLFGLPANLPAVVIDGDDPGQNDAAIEAYLDVEISNSVAPGAKVVLYTAAGTVLSDGLYSAGLRAVEDNQVSVLSLSYVSCEASLGAAGNAGWAALWQEAAAQGITVFVASGDGGSAGCDFYGNASFAQSGLAVNGLGSTPYNVAVGGTDFYYSNYAVGGSALSSQIQTYWSTTSSATPKTSLLHAAPEQVWNNAFGLNASNGGVYSTSSSTILAGSGGTSSSAIYPAVGPATGYPKPAWQAGAGVPADGRRDLPDVSLFAANGKNYVYYPICAIPGDCVISPSNGSVFLQSVGGTSASSPAMAGIQALVNQATGARQGQANYVYYPLANKTLSTKPFRDVTVGGNEVPCVQGSAYCMAWTSGTAKGFYAESGFLAAAGYDRATGLGSVDVASLIKNWSAVVFRPTVTTLSVSPASFAHGKSTSIKATVAAKTGTGTPTGIMGLVDSDAVAFSNALGVFSLSGGALTTSLTNLPGGTYQLVAQYGGDTTFGASVSTPVTITVSKENDTLAVSGWVLNPLDNRMYPLQAGMSVPYGSVLYLDAQPQGVNGAKIVLGQFSPATGAVTYVDKFGPGYSQTAVMPLDSQGIAEWTPASLAIGSHAISATYGGDASYNPSSAPTAMSLTVYRGTTTVSVKPMETSIAAGSTLTVDVKMVSSYLPLTGSLPTGNVSVTLGGQTVTAPWKSWGKTGSATEEAVLTFTNVPAGIHPLSASYGGDGNWYGSSAVYGSITSMAKLAIPTVTLTTSKTAYGLTDFATVVGTVTGVAGKAAPSGTLYFTWQDASSYYAETLQAKTTTSSGFTLTFPAYQLANGSNLMVATFLGNANYAAQSSAALVLTLNGGDFSLSTTTQEVAVKVGGTGTGSVTVLPVNGYSGTVSVTCSAPAGITCTPTVPAPTVGGGVADAITLKVASTVKPGIYAAVVAVTGGGRTHTAQILVAVQ